MSKTAEEKKKNLKEEILREMIMLSTSGFGLVAALAWNNVIQEFVDQYIKKWIPNGGGLFSLFLYAVLITILAVFITYQLSKTMERVADKN